MTLNHSTIYTVIPLNKSTPLNAWNIALILRFNYSMYEMRRHFTIKVWYLLIHEIPSYLKKWKGSTEELFNISTSYCIPEDKYKFHWIQSPRKLQDFQFILIYQEQVTESVVLSPSKTKRAEVTFQLRVSSCSLGHPAFCKDRMAENSATKLSKTSRPQLKIMHGKPRHGQSQGIKRDHKENLNAEQYYQ